MDIRRRSSNTQSNEEEPYYILKTNNPYTFYVPDKYDPDHFMPWVHPFTSVISGPTGSGKSVFVRGFVHNIKHMVTSIPDRILWCYGEYQTLYGTVDGVEFQQGLPDLDNLDSREKHLIILDDLMDETDMKQETLDILRLILLCSIVAKLEPTAREQFDLKTQNSQYGYLCGATDVFT